MNNNVKVKQPLKGTLGPDLSWMDEPIKSDQWKNIYFFNDGRSLEGAYVHASEEVAKARADQSRANAELKELTLGDQNCVLNQPTFMWRDLSYVIQIPVKV